MKVKTSKGFTLAELLIVMAIIVVLAAVAIPTFSRQLETARETGDMEIIRNAYTDALAIAIIDASDGTLDGMKNAVADSLKDLGITTFGGTNDSAKEYTMSIGPLTQAGAGWSYINDKIAGRTVQALTDATLYANTVTFKFALDTTTGEVALVADASTPIALTKSA